MSMKRAPSWRAFPIQDEHERGKNGVGVARPGADTDAECRKPEPGSDPGIFAVEGADRVQQRWAGGTQPVGGASIGGAELREAREARAGIGASLRAESNGVKRGADHAVDPRVSGSWCGTSPAVSKAQVHSQVQGRRHCVVGGSGSGAWAVERTGHAADFAARLRAVRREAVRAAGADQRGALVQSAGERALSQPGGGVRADAVHCGRDRAAAQAQSARPAGLPAGGHGASRRQRGSQGRVPHQRRGRGDAMASGGLHREDQRGVPGAGAGSGVGAVSLSHPRFSYRQRLGVYQPSGGGNVTKAARRIHQEPGVPEPGQCSGGRQKRRGDPEVDGLWTHGRPTRGDATGVLCKAPESVPELSPALRLRHGELGRARQTETEIQRRRLSDAVGETAVAAGSAAVFETRVAFAGTGETGAGHQRHRMRSPDERGQNQVTAAVPDAVVAEVQLTKGRGNAGPVERVEKQKQLSHSFHRPLEISQKARDFHIPTAQLRGPGKVENQKQVSHFPTAARDDDSCSRSKNQKTKKPKKGSRPLRGLLISLSVSVSNGTGFMLIVQLENARPAASQYSATRPARMPTGSLARIAPRISEARPPAPNRRL